MAKADIQHVLVPKHTKLSEKDKKQLLTKYNIDSKQLPKILKGDPAIANFNAKTGDVIKIERTSMSAGSAVFYREVSNV